MARTRCDVDPTTVTGRGSTIVRSQWPRWGRVQTTRACTGSLAVLRDMLRRVA
jgi:hypothetical protein